MRTRTHGFDIFFMNDINASHYVAERSLTDVSFGIAESEVAAATDLDEIEFKRNIRRKCQKMNCDVEVEQRCRASATAEYSVSVPDASGSSGGARWLMCNIMIKT